MRLFPKNAIEVIDCDINLSDAPQIINAKLLHINGTGALRTRSKIIPGDYRILSQVVLNDTPLIQFNTPECPTCSKLIATGYGLSNANCSELTAISERINSPFESLNKSIDDLSPLFALLESGLYLIADALCIPTDGNGHFFWDVPDSGTLNPAANDILLSEYDYKYVHGTLSYLYPTQDSSCYNPMRVQYY